VFKQSFVTAAVLVLVLAVILIQLSATEIRETLRRKAVERVLLATFGTDAAQATVFDWKIERSAADDLRVTVAVGMPHEFTPTAAQQLQNRLTAALERPVTLFTSVVPTLILPARQVSATAADTGKTVAVFQPHFSEQLTRERN
jgi:hypothetical protein